MAVTATPIFPQAMNTGLVQILPADTSALKTVYTAAANGSVINQLYVTSTDTSARDIQFSILRSATSYILGTLTIPLSAGNTNSAPSVAVFRSTQFPGMTLDAFGNPILYMQAGDVLQVNALTTVTALKVISIHANAGDF